ncbi:MAG TPA: hypothetical protein VFG69_11635 [Nannocystaceae bacterium]|nr:hypothetical protein [Nannocystaceae bacterium]
MIARRSGWGGALLLVGCGAPSEDARDGGTSSGESSGAADTDAASSSGPATESSSTGDAVDDSSTGAPEGGTIVVRFAFVHGVLGSADAQQTAQDQALDLEDYLVAHAEERAAQYELAHPGLELEIASTRLNLYTDVQDALLVPGLDEMSDGTGIATANRWREQLARKLDLAYPGQGNLVVIGHSTGARAAMEVAAGVVDDAGPQSHVWGVEDRIAAVVTLHGMIDALGNPEYDFLGPIDFLTGCKLAQAVGWCEYAANISGVAASDWVAAEKHALALIAWGQCSPSIWTGENDKSLPLRAQGSANLAGMTMTPIKGGSFAPAHGVLYGNFCHSDPTSRSSPAHDAAVAAAMDRVLDFVFVAAPRVANLGGGAQTIDVDPRPAETWSSPIARGDGCGAEEVDAGAPEVVGSCIHPGGSDHPMDEHDMVETTDGPDCTGSVRWQHLHTDEMHAARLWMKTYSRPAAGGLVETLSHE